MTIHESSAQLCSPISFHVKSLDLEEELLSFEGIGESGSSCNGLASCSIADSSVTLALLLPFLPMTYQLKITNKPMHRSSLSSKAHFKPTTSSILLPETKPTFPTLPSFSLNPQPHTYQHTTYNHPYDSWDDERPSSRIADEVEGVGEDRNGMLQFEETLRRKMECFEEETGKLMALKEQEISILTQDLLNAHQRIKEQQIIIAQQVDELSSLSKIVNNDTHKQKEQTILKLQDQLSQLTRSNQALKQSIRLLSSTTYNPSTHNRRNYSSLNIAPSDSGNIYTLKREVAELRNMVADAQNRVQNCPNCFILKRENQQLVEAYRGVQNEYSRVKAHKQLQEETMLKDITVQIQQNQSMVRREKERERQILQPSRMRKTNRYRQSVARRCRTLTDQF